LAARRGGLPFYQANLLAEELRDRAISEHIDKIPNDAPDVYISDISKIENITMDAKKIADQLDQEEKLIPLLDELVDKEDSQWGHMQG